MARVRLVKGSIGTVLETWSRTTTTSSIHALVFATATLMVCAPVLTAQSLHTSGSVTGSDGKPLRNAVILAENQDASPPTISATTDQNGEYSLAGIKPGMWRATVSLPGYVSATNEIIVDDTGDVQSSLHFGLLRLPAPVGPGIRPLTAESLKEALSMTEADVSKVSMPLLVKLVAAEHDPATMLYSAMTLAKDAPFGVELLTPFSRAAMAAAQARRKFATPRSANLAALNSGGVVVNVTAGSSFLTADAVEGMVIRRGDQVIKPLTSRIQPAVIGNRMGAKSPSAVGVFTFPMNAFAPTSPLTIVIVGNLRNFEIPMTTVELGMLR